MSNATGGGAENGPTPSATVGPDPTRYHNVSPAPARRSTLPENDLSFGIGLADRTAERHLGDRVCAMAEEQVENVYTIRPNAAGGFEVLVKLASEGAIRRRPGFATELAAQAWIDRHKASRGRRILAKRRGSSLRR